jgi:predicted component of type VI protein secretion system
MEVTLIVISGVHKGRQIHVTTPRFLIGRARHCQLRPVRPDVGREHCAIEVRPEGVFLRDCGSTNGTILNDHQVVEGEVRLTSGDVFEVGPLHFRIAITPPADSDSLFDENDLYTGEPGEREPGLDSTILVSSPHIVRSRPPTPPPDEGPKLS